MSLLGSASRLRIRPLLKLLVTLALCFSGVRVSASAVVPLDGPSTQSINAQLLFSGVHKYHGCPDGITVVALVNDLYFSEALKWKQQFIDHLNITNVHIINVAPARKLSYFQFLVQRTRKVMSLLRDQNVTCLLSADVDTYWVRNPLPFIESLANEDDYDIIASQGTVYPNEVHKQWGHVLCGGFWMFRRTRHALNVLLQIANSRMRKPDDQKLVNMYLWKYYDMNWVMAPDGGRIGAGRESIKVRTIPENMIQRRQATDFDFDTGYVFHPLGAKDPNVKARLREQLLEMIAEGHTHGGSGLRKGYESEAR